MIRRLIERIECWFFDPLPLYPMVLMRVVLGGIFCASYLGKLPDFRLLYGAGSIAWFPTFRAYAAGRFRSPLEPVVAWVDGAGLEGFVGVAYTILLIASLAFAAGLLTRLSGAVTLLLHQFFWTLNPEVSWGWAMVIVGFTLYTIAAPSGRRGSLDAWVAARRGQPAASWLAPAWPLRLVQLNVCVMYAIAGFSRLDHSGWLEGRMLLEALANSLFGRFDVDWRGWQPLLRPFSYATFLIEPLAPVALWIKHLSAWCAVALIAMHAGLELTTDVGFWNFMMGGALCSFLPTRWLAWMDR